MKKVLTLVLVALLAISLVACGGGSGDGAEAKIKVGVSMPTKSLQRWNQDGDNMKAELEKAGYEVDLQYGGDNVVAEQVAQIENMITSGCKVLVIAAIDGESLSEVLATAKENDIAVIAYDRLIRNTDAVSYYATFDNTEVGRTQGRFIEEALGLATAEGPFNLEIFTGSPDDNNARLFYEGAMEILNPYIESGKVVVLSEQTSQAATATQGWSAEEAQKRMENLISSYDYSPTGTKLDAILSSNDSCALGIVTALVNAGYDATNIPVITGQDCDLAITKNMWDGLQAMSIFKDTRDLAAVTVEMVNAIINGTEVPVNDTTTNDNGVFVVPSYHCTPIACTKDQMEDILLNSGYYKSWDEMGIDPNA